MPKTWRVITYIRIIADDTIQNIASLKTWVTDFLFVFWCEELVFQCSNMLVPGSVPLPEFKNKNHPIILK